jgi:hypothetical protein
MSKADNQILLSETLDEDVLIDFVEVNVDGEAINDIEVLHADKVVKGVS